MPATKWKMLALSALGHIGQGDLSVIAEIVSRKQLRYKCWN